MANLLHLTPHLGGGVGSVLTAICGGLAERTSWQQEIVSLEYANEFAKTWSDASGIEIQDEVPPDSIELHEKVQKADAVLLHFWNHPLLYQFLHSFSGKTARIAFWAHTNGHHPPYRFPDSVLEYPEIFVTTSAYSLQAPTIAPKSDTWKEEHLRVIHSTAGTANFDTIEPRPHTGFNVGYIGTVDYCKLHRDFLKICAAVDIPDVRFIICGGDQHREIEQEAAAMGLASRFDFRGKVSNVPEVLAELDVFAYPLSPENYGTGEQVLIEAMAAGVPQVVLDNGPEAFVVQNGETGVIAKDNSGFAMAIETLYKDAATRKQFADASRKHAKTHFSLENEVNAWDEVLASLLTRPAKIGILPAEEGSPWQLFLLALGACQARTLFESVATYSPQEVPEELLAEVRGLPEIFLGATRGSFRHYERFLQDPLLKFLREQI